MSIILYSTHCPKCHIVEMKLQQHNLQYMVLDDIDDMLEKGLLSAPYLQVDDQMMDFGEAVKYLNSLPLPPKD